jgi:hypothetical protein
VAEAVAASQSGIPDVKVFVSKSGSSAAKFSAQVTFTDYSGTVTTAMLGDNNGGVKSYSNLSELLNSITSIAPKVTTLPAASSFVVQIENPEALASTASTTVQTIASLTKKLLKVRDEVKANKMKSDIRAIELTGNAALATGTVEQQAKYAELVLRKQVIDDLGDVYDEQAVDLAALITAMGGTPPADPNAVS